MPWEEHLQINDKGAESMKSRGILVSGWFVLLGGFSNGIQAGGPSTLGAAVQLAFSQCGCLCIEGVPKTLCTTVEEAQAKPGLCGQQHCPEYVAAEVHENSRTRYLSPNSFADNCRDVRVFDPSVSGYMGIKVCDVQEIGTAN